MYIMIGLILLTLSIFLRVGYINNQFQKNIKVGDVGYIFINDSKAIAKVIGVHGNNKISVSTLESISIVINRNSIYKI